MLNHLETSWYFSPKYLLQPASPKDKDIFPHNHNALITPKTVTQHDILSHTVSYLDFSTFPSYILYSCSFVIQHLISSPNFFLYDVLFYIYIFFLSFFFYFLKMYFVYFFFHDIFWRFQASYLVEDPTTWIFLFILHD